MGFRKIASRYERLDVVFNIELSPNIVRFGTESDVLKGNTDVPKVAMA